MSTNSIMRLFGSYITLLSDFKSTHIRALSGETEINFAEGVEWRTRKAYAIFSNVICYWKYAWLCANIIGPIILDYIILLNEYIINVHVFEYKIDT